MFRDFQNMAERVSVPKAAELLGMCEDEFGDAKAVWIYGEPFIHAFIEEYVRGSGAKGWRCTVCGSVYMDELVREKVERKVYLDSFLWGSMKPKERSTKVLREALLEFCDQAGWIPGKIPALEAMSGYEREWMRRFAFEWRQAEAREVNLLKPVQDYPDNALEGM